jgi:hypothetical protein
MAGTALFPLITVRLTGVRQLSVVEWLLFAATNGSNGNSPSLTPKADADLNMREGNY